jgi:DNA invertase Pin-like site-specific DNA recombinase
MIYGYVRVSTAHQNVENGRFEIANFAEKSGFSIDKWVVEQISSRESLSKRKLGAVIKKLKEGDILLTTEISRLGRNLMEIMGILNICLSKKCQIWTIKENYRLGFDIQSKVLAFAFGLSAEIERNLISERTKESLHRLKSSGKRLGRPRGSGKAMRRLHSQRERIKALLERGETKREVARIACVSEATLYRFLRVIRQNKWNRNFFLDNFVNSHEMIIPPTNMLRQFRETVSPIFSKLSEIAKNQLMLPSLGIFCFRC